mmetsp:Transcript_20342/g.23041  ORF Transcript_20342/g.23041 Transcript_20342/m.23041 type:complete len:732 (+) Transcript_20342:38-2233(+)
MNFITSSPDERAEIAGKSWIPLNSLKPSILSSPCPKKRFGNDSSSSPEVDRPNSSFRSPDLSKIRKIQNTSACFGGRDQSPFGSSEKTRFENPRSDTMAYSFPAKSLFRTIQAGQLSSRQFTNESNPKSARKLNRSFDTLPNGLTFLRDQQQQQQKNTTRGRRRRSPNPNFRSPGRNSQSFQTDARHTISHDPYSRYQEFSPEDLNPYQLKNRGGGVGVGVRLSEEEFSFDDDERDDGDQMSDPPSINLSKIENHNSMFDGVTNSTLLSYQDKLNEAYQYISLLISNQNAKALEHQNQLNSLQNGHTQEVNALFGKYNALTDDFCQAKQAIEVLNQQLVNYERVIEFQQNRIKELEVSEESDGNVDGFGDDGGDNHITEESSDYGHTCRDQEEIFQGKLKALEREYEMLLRHEETKMENLRRQMEWCQQQAVVKERESGEVIRRLREENSELMGREQQLEGSTGLVVDLDVVKETIAENPTGEERQSTISGDDSDSRRSILFALQNELEHYKSEVVRLSDIIKAQTSRLETFETRPRLPSSSTLAWSQQDVLNGQRGTMKGFQSAHNLQVDVAEADQAAKNDAKQKSTKKRKSEPLDDETHETPKYDEMLLSRRLSEGQNGNDCGQNLSTNLEFGHTPDRFRHVRGQSMSARQSRQDNLDGRSELGQDVCSLITKLSEFLEVRSDEETTPQNEKRSMNDDITGGSASSTVLFKETVRNLSFKLDQLVQHKQ